jgi:bifunctional DNA-binding transcriptional regulator/antitoxin component of YhaV-PrlF toxin-antitoxin module
LVKFRVKANPQGQYYFPKEVREELGSDLELFCNAKAAVVFPQGTHIRTILESLEVIEKDLKHRLQLKENNQNGQDTG